MNQVLIFICFAIVDCCGFVTLESVSETESAILERLEATEKLVQNLCEEVASLKAQDQIYKEQISVLKKQLNLQQQRNSHLGRLNRRLAISKHMTKPRKEELKSMNPANDETIQRIRRVGSESHIAFFAKMGSSLEHAGVHQNIIFEIVMNNDGNGYNNHLGTFIAPVSGTYVFSTTLTAFYHTSAHAQFVKNGIAVSTMYFSGPKSGYDMTGQTIVLKLNKGDDIMVQNVDLDKSYYGGHHSTFCGFLLYEEYSNLLVVGK